MREYCMRWLISIPLLFLLSGCADIGYYWNNARGHLAVMDKRIDIEDLLADDGIDPELHERLVLVREIRRFSIDRLGLPENGSYLSYVELERPYVLQNLFAAPEFSTRLQRWCYLVIGCASYRGYYDEQRLLDYVDKLKAEGLEIYISHVPAYSTLGWFDDPVLSSFVYWPDYRLAGLIFHELTHQQVYIDDDTTFNESLASAVQQVGTELWLQSRDDAEELGRLSRWLAYRGEVIALIESTREQLAGIYRRDIPDDRKRALKSAAFAAAREAHTLVAEKHGTSGGFTAWFADELNNAKIGSVAAYNDAVPAFVNMIRAHEADFAAFFDYAAAIGRLDKQRRDTCLLAWKQDSGAADGVCPKIGVDEATAS